MKLDYKELKYIIRVNQHKKSVGIILELTNSDFEQSFWPSEKGFLPFF